MLPPDLKTRAQQLAKERGVSLGELVRESLETTVNGESSGRRQNDSLFADDAVFRGEAPNDLSLNHDRYLYGEAENQAEVRR